jgi:hypothetical protein
MGVHKCWQCMARSMQLKCAAIGLQVTIVAGQQIVTSNSSLLSTCFKHAVAIEEESVVHQE